MTDDISHASASEVGQFAPLGEVLAAARNAKNLSVENVSTTLRLSPKQIAALENNDFSALPQAMATRGFIRNYARLLELDAEPLLASYRARMPDGAPTTLNVQTSISREVSIKKDRSAGKYGWLVLLLGLLMAGAYYLTLPPAPVSTAASNEVVEIVPLPAAPLPEVPLPAAEHPPEVVSLPASSEANALPATTVAAGLQLRPTADMVSPSAAVKASPGTTKAQVTLSATDKAWVQVKDQAGAIVYEKMLAANSSDSFEGQPPLYLWLGNAKATTVSFMGNPVDVASKTYNNIARLRLE